MITTNGVPNAVVPLNYAVGSGSANAEEAYAQLRESTNRFWDLHTLLGTGTERFYTFGTGKFIGGTPGEPLISLTATLVWDRRVDFTVSTDLNDDSVGVVTKNLLSNLDLILQQETAPGVWEDIYQSAGTLDNEEHIYLPALGGGGNYRLNVRGTNIVEPAFGEEYALVVAYGVAPEPGVVGLLVVGFAVVGVRRRRR